MADPTRVRPSPTSTRPKRRMTPEQRREHLITTALQLYSQRSAEQITIDDIVDTADVSRALFYRYFTNLPDLHLAALGRVVDDLVAELTVPSTDDIRSDLRTAVSRFLNFAETYSASYTALLRTGSAMADSNTAPLIDGARDRVIDRFREHLGLDELPGALTRTLRAWVTAVETTVLSWLQHRDIGSEELGNWLTDQMFAMLTTTAEHDPTTAALLHPLLS